MEDTKQKSILAIDDNLIQLTIFRSILSSHYEFTPVKSASEALKLMNSKVFDLILLDIEMPNISGFEFLSDIRKIPSYIGVPIIIVSGNTGTDFLRKARSSSAADVLTKPVLPNVLVSTIEKAFAAKT